MIFFNKIKSVKEETKQDRKKQGLLNQLKHDMSVQYSFNPPDKKKKKEIELLRLQFDIENLALQTKWQEEVDELTIRFMKVEIDILKREIL